MRDMVDAFDGLAHLKVLPLGQDQLRYALSGLSRQGMVAVPCLEKDVCQALVQLVDALPFHPARLVTGSSMNPVFQDFQLLYDRNVYDNLSFVLKATGWKDQSKIKTRCEYILETINLQEKSKSMIHKLSSGQQQKLCIGRSLLNHPDIIIADEPTGNLDTETSSEIMNLICKIHKLGKTIIIATHDEKIIKLFPAKKLKLENKSLIELN